MDSIAFNADVSATAVRFAHASSWSRRWPKTIKAHLEGILTAVVTGATNAWAEDFNAMIQKVKRDARGFRNKELSRQQSTYALADSISTQRRCGIGCYPH